MRAHFDTTSVSVRDFHCPHPKKSPDVKANIEFLNCVVSNRISEYKNCLLRTRLKELDKNDPDVFKSIN